MPTPAVVTVTVLDDTPWFTRYQLTGSFTDTQETLAVKHDASARNYIRHGVTAPKSAISRIQYHCDGAGVVKFYFDATTPLLAHSVSGDGDLNLDPDSNIHNTAGTGITGDIVATTTGFTSGQTYTITLTLRKEPADTSTAPQVTALAIVDAKSGTYVTGDTLRIQATFDQVINVESASSYIDFALASGTIRATYKGPQVVSAAQTGSGTTKAVFEYTFKATDGAAAGDLTVSNIDSSILGTDVATLPVINVLPSLDLSASTVNLPTIVSVDGITNGHHYVTGNPITLTAHFNEPVVVTGTPQIELGINTDNREAVYVSGSGTKDLLFRYTPVVSGDGATAGQFEVDSPIDLNGGTILGNGAVATLTFTPPTTDTVLVN